MRDIVKVNDCWVWQAVRNRFGYGTIGVKSKQRLAHRMSYATFVGEIPDGMLVLHRCDNPPCINPAHLWLGTHLDNSRDASKKGRASSTVKVFGESHPNSKLTDVKAREIIALLGAKPRLSYKKIGRMFFVCSTTVALIDRGVAWQHLPR